MVATMTGYGMSHGRDSHSHSSHSNNLPFGLSPRRALLAGLGGLLVLVQVYRVMMHNHEHMKSTHHMEWLVEKTQHTMLSCPICPRCPKREKCQKCDDQPPCPQCPLLPDDVPLQIAEETKRRFHVEPHWPQHAQDTLAHMQEKLISEMQLRKQAQLELKVAREERAAFNDRLRSVKHALAESEQSQKDCFTAGALERNRCAVKMYDLMGRALKNRILAFELEKGRTINPEAQEALEEVPWATPASLAPADPLAEGSPPEALDKEFDRSTVNETMAQMLARRLHETVVALGEQGWELDRKLLKELEEDPAYTAYEVENDNEEGILEEYISAVREDWVETLKKSKGHLLKELEVMLSNHSSIERLVARTPDAERMFPDLFPTMKSSNTSAEWDAEHMTIVEPAASPPPVGTKGNPKDPRQPVGTKGNRNKRAGSPPPVTATVYRQLNLEAGSFSAPKYNRCAVVGNSQRMLLMKHGKQIDEHDVVMRLNNAPTIGFEPFIGSKTTHRLINNQWTRTYGAGGKLPLEWNVTVLASRTDQSSYIKLFQQLKTVRGDIAIVRLTTDGANHGGKLLRAIGSRIEKWRGMQYAGKGSPSSGFIAVYLMMQLCKSVTVYGVGLEGCAGVCSGSTAWHYWQDEQFETSREFGDNPHHSFELEHDVIRILHADGYLKLENPEKQMSRIDEKKKLQIRQPVLMQAATELYMGSKLEADKKCAHTTGSVCGCPRTCVTPTGTFLRELCARARLESERALGQSFERGLNLDRIARGEGAAGADERGMASQALERLGDVNAASRGGRAGARGGSRPNARPPRTERASVDRTARRAAEGGGDMPTLSRHERHASRKEKEDAAVWGQEELSSQLERSIQGLDDSPEVASMVAEMDETGAAQPEDYPYTDELGSGGAGDKAGADQQDW